MKMAHFWTKKQHIEILSNEKKLLHGDIKSDNFLLLDLDGNRVGRLELFSLPELRPTVQSPTTRDDTDEEMPPADLWSPLGLGFDWMLYSSHPCPCPPSALARETLGRKRPQIANID